MKKLVLSLVALVGFVAITVAQDVSDKKEVETKEIKKIEVSEDLKLNKAVNAEYKVTPVENKKASSVAVEKKEVTEMAIEKKEMKMDATIEERKPEVAVEEKKAEK